MTRLWATNKLIAVPPLFGFSLTGTCRWGHHGHAHIDLVSESEFHLGATVDEVMVSRRLLAWDDAGGGISPDDLDGRRGHIWRLC